MAQPPQTRLNTVYLVDQVGDTLVVQPRGDAAGFSIQVVNSEMATITQLAQDPAVKHLIVDLAGGRYFGSIILGSLVQLNQMVRSRGGRAGLCGASEDMQDVLRLMKLDQLWEMYPTLSGGLNAIASIPVRERLWRKRRAFAILATIAACVLLYVYFPRPDYARINYEKMHTLWQEVESREALAGDEEWARLKKQVEKETKPIVADIERRTKQRDVGDAERFLIYIARDLWPTVMERNHPDRDAYRSIARKYFRASEAIIEGRPIPSLNMSDVHVPDPPPTVPSTTSVNSPR